MQTRPARRLLHKILSGVLGQSIDSTDLPTDNAEWQSLLRLSSAHLVTSLLRWALQQNSLLAGLPVEVLEFLEAFHALNLDDNRRYEDQLAHLIRTLNGIGIRPVLLKGAAALIGVLYPTPGERFIGDIDILIASHQLGEALAALRAAGYIPGIGGEFSDVEEYLQGGAHHYPAIKNPDWPVLVELHVFPVHRFVDRLLGSEEITRDATLITWRGGECLLPSPTHFVTHNVIHAYLVDHALQSGISIRQLFEFVFASRIYAGQIDWLAIQQRFDTCSEGTALRCYLALANDYFGFQPPTELPVGRRIRLRTALYCALMDAPRAIYLLGLVRGFQTRAYRLVRDPRVLKRLLTKGFYLRFFQELRACKTTIV